MKYYSINSMCPNLLLLILDFTIFIPVTLIRLFLIYIHGSRYGIKTIEFLDIMMHSENKYFNQEKHIPTIDTINSNLKLNINQMFRLSVMQTSQIEQELEKKKNIENELNELRVYKLESDEKEKIELHNLRIFKENNLLIVKPLKNEIENNLENNLIFIKETTIKNIDSDFSHINNTEKKNIKVNENDLDLDEDIDQLIEKYDDIDEAKDYDIYT